MHQLVAVVVDGMGDAFPELKRNPTRVAELIKDEEVSFGRTLDRGIELFDVAAAEAIARAYTPMLPNGYIFVGRQSIVSPGSREPGQSNVGQESITSLTFSKQDLTGLQQLPVEVALRQLQAAGEPVSIAAADAFKLHDTFGFPIDLTRIMAEERGLSADVAGYEQLMEKAKEVARSGGKADDATKRLTELPAAALAQLSQAGVRPTLDNRQVRSRPNRRSGAGHLER